MGNNTEAEQAFKKYIELVHNVAINDLPAERQARLLFLEQQLAECDQQPERAWRGLRLFSGAAKSWKQVQFLQPAQLYEQLLYSATARSPIYVLCK